MKKLQVLFSLLFFIGFTYAQNNNSPYSIIGIGDIERSYFDRSSGMGSAGVALSSNKFLYISNPASFSNIDEHFFHFEVSARYKGVTYSGTPINNGSVNSTSDIQFKRISLAIKIKPRWALSFGVTPFSTSNYSFYANKSVYGTNFSVPAYYEGTGSTNQAYITNSFRVNKNLSIGLQSAFLFGQLKQTETISGTGFDSTLVTTRNISIGNPYFKLGLQYKKKVNNNLALSFGATGSLQTKLRANYSLLVRDGTVTLTNNEAYKNNYFTLPQMYTVGTAATIKDKYTVALEYNYQPWNSLNYKGLGYTLTNSNRISAGFEVSNKISVGGVSIEKNFLQAGLYYSNSYLNIYGQQLNDYGVTLGAGFNARRSSLGMQAALEIGTRGTTANGLIKENYIQVTTIINFREIWYPRNYRRYD